jgi:hypothetical protein
MSVSASSVSRQAHPAPAPKSSSMRQMSRSKRSAGTIEGEVRIRILRNYRRRRHGPGFRGAFGVGPRPLRRPGGAGLESIPLKKAKFLVQEIFARRQQTHIGPAFVQLEPALLDSILDAGAELRAAAL